MSSEIGKGSLFKVGAICASIVGICYLTIVILAFFSPKSVITYQANDQYFKDFQPYKNIFVLLKCLMVIANGAMIGVVASLYKLKAMKEKGILTLFSILAVVGLGIGMYEGIEDATEVPYLAQKYETSSEEIQHVIIAFGVANPAIYALSLGLPGVWFLVMSYSFRKTLPKLLVILGFFWGVGNIFTALAHILILTWLIYFIQAGALVIAPIWSILQTRLLWKAHKK